MNITSYKSIAELNAASARGEQVFLYAPGDFIEPTPPEAPYQPGDIVYLIRVRDGYGNGVPTDLINAPLKVQVCMRCPVDNAEMWELDLLRPDGTDVEYFIYSDDVVKTKPF